MKPTIWVRSAEVATGLDTNQKGAQTTQVHHPPKPSLDIPWFCFYLLQLSTTQITQPTSHWAWLFFKPSATWMHPSVPKSVNRTSCPAAFYDPNFVETFGACVRLMEPTTFAGSDPVQPGPNMPQPPNPPGVQELEHRMLPQDLRQGCGTSWKKVWKKWQKLGGYRLRFLKKGWFFFGGGSNLSTKDSQLFQTTWKPKEQIEHSSPKGLFFFFLGGSKKSVNFWKQREQQKKTTFYRPLNPSQQPPVAPMGFSSMTSCANVWLFFKPLKNAIAPGARNPRANAIRKVRVHHKTPNIQMPSFLYIVM